MSDSTPEQTRGNSNPETATTTEPAATPASGTSGTGTSAPETTGEETLYCVNHPTVETLLRCNRCGRPICLKCAELTDVGYRCKECIRGVQDKYFTASTGDNFIAFGVALAVTAVIAPILGILLGMVRFFGWIIALMLGGVAGGTLVQIVRAAIRKRRGRYIRHYAVAGVMMGVVVGSLVAGALLGVSPLAFLINIPLLIFTVLAALAANRLLR
ncbi:MAG: hypothetical protein WDZ49_08940 [Litorilinea sp.]